MSTDELIVTRRGHLLSIELNRPSARNAVSPAMLDALVAAIEDARATRTDVVTISGAGGFFCAGADIRSYTDPHGRLDELEAFTRAARDLCRAIETLDAVTVAAVDGPCLGGGFEIALACDLIIAAETARFGLPETRLGLVPGWGGTQRLTEAVGPRRARELVLTASVVSAETAAAWGIVTRVVISDELRPTLEATADDLLTRAPLALAGAKRAIAAAVADTWPTVGAERETAELMALFASHDGAEGISAFVEKRPAQFTGA
ncbi:enoyl-CoA hydratase/isomerase family protein [Salinibacterium sp. ZJ70]|uniref:enoyl-CoA hydratase/isomerase family protein n=1 Tax=Salinibacterium sp. ZJ70 TaxID=2708084 RepID=UPI0014240912|nr:enoyl-CoA hydratase/isomerase family protein [Salinibacterium sp. ZJ70]